MFDLTSGTLDRPFRDVHSGAAVVSVASHVAIVGVVIGTMFYAIGDQLPEVPTVMAFVAPMAPPPPPPPPPPAAPRAAAAQPTRPAPNTGPTFTVPAAIPDGIQPETGIDLRDEGGVVGGVEGGIAGGVLGGILGGMVTAEMPPPPPAPPKPRRVGGDLKAPALIRRVEPEYPAVAVSAKVAGMVILEATVNEAGTVTNVKVLRSIPLLDRAAVAAVKEWRYEPLLLNGAPTPFILVVTLTFSLR